MYHNAGLEQRTDPSQNFIEAYANDLDAIFLPKTVAVIGAKDDVGSVGRTIMVNLLSNTFGGTIYPVNPKRSQVLGIKAYPSIYSIPEPIDLVVIVTPAQTVPHVISECVECHVKAAIIISAGFKELGEHGLLLEKQILERARSKMRIIGPNCLGVMNPVYGLNATFAKGMALKGNIAFISQSGAMCTSVLDWSMKERIGFSSFVSVGSMADVNWGDLIVYLGKDPSTHSILIYMETIGDARAFMSAAREVALDKPIVVIKPGRSTEAAKAAASHTGSLAGSDEVFDAAMERVGVLRVNSIAELFHMAKVLGKIPKPHGPNLAIVTNAGGPSVLATDAAVLEGAHIPPLTTAVTSTLNKFLPAAWSHSNPCDILGDADPARYAKTVDVLANDPNNDGVLVILSPQDMTDPIGTAESLRSWGRMKSKPIMASWMGGSYVEKGVEILNQAHIPTFEYPDDAAWAFATLWRYTENLKSLYETPRVSDAMEKYSTSSKARNLIHRVQEEGRTLLSEHESKELLSYYGIPIVETVVCLTEKEAVLAARKLGYPVVVKLYSKTITHKSDIGGVRLGITTDEAVKTSFIEIQEAVKAKYSEKEFLGVTVQRMVKSGGIELILGSSSDSQFGPVMLFGAGGTMVEIFKDRALGFAPLNSTLARRMMQKTKIYEALKGFRGEKAVRIEQLEQLVVRFSLMLVDNPSIKECDINPLRASSEEIIALDARVVLFGNEEVQSIPKPAIRSYPIEYIEEFTLRNREKVVIRPIMPEDEPAVVRFHKELSETSVRQRYFDFVSLNDRVQHERLCRICFNDFDREIALVAVIDKEVTESRTIIGVVRLTRICGTQHADLKLIISDAYHGKGLGSELVGHIIRIAQRESIHSINATILSENTGMISILKKFGFDISLDDTGFYTKARLNLYKE